MYRYRYQISASKCKRGELLDHVEAVNWFSTELLVFQSNQRQNIGRYRGYGSQSDTADHQRIVITEKVHQIFPVVCITYVLHLKSLSNAVKVN